MTVSPSLEFRLLGCTRCIRTEVPRFSWNSQRIPYLSNKLSAEVQHACVSLSKEGSGSSVNELFMEVSCVVYGGLYWDEGSRKRLESKIGNVAKALFIHSKKKAVSWSVLWWIRSLFWEHFKWGGNITWIGCYCVVGHPLTEHICSLYPKQGYCLCPN